MCISHLQYTVHDPCLVALHKHLHCLSITYPNVLDGRTSTSADNHFVHNAKITQDITGRPRSHVRSAKQHILRHSQWSLTHLHPCPITRLRFPLSKYASVTPNDHWMCILTQGSLQMIHIQSDHSLIPFDWTPPAVSPSSPTSVHGQTCCAPNRHYMAYGGHASVEPSRVSNNGFRWTTTTITQWISNKAIQTNAENVSQHLNSHILCDHRRSHTLPAHGRPPRRRPVILGKAPSATTKRPIGWGQHRWAAASGRPLRRETGSIADIRECGCRTGPLYTGRCPYTGSHLRAYWHACVPMGFHGDMGGSWHGMHSVSSAYVSLGCTAITSIPRWILFRKWTPEPRTWLTLNLENHKIFKQTLMS